MNKLKVLIGSLLVLATMFLSTYALSSPLPHPVCVASLKAPSQVTAGQAATIDASSSFCFISGSSLRVPIANYVFNFGDGKSFSGTTPVVSHVYTSAGTYYPSLIVNSQGWQAIASASVNVIQAVPAVTQDPIIYMPQPSIPVPTLNVTCGRAGIIKCWNAPPLITSFNAEPRFGFEPLTVTFTGSAVDFNGDPLTYILFFDWNNNESLNKTGVINATESVIGTYTYAAGMYQTKMEVSDGKNKTSRTVTIHVNTTIPSNKPPVACFTASGTAGFLPFTVTFDGSCSNDPDGTIESYSWEIVKRGNGMLEEQNGTGTPGTLQYTFTEEGYYFVYLTVWDNQGESNQMNLTVHTEQLLLPPTIGWYRTQPASGYAPLTVTFKGSAIGIYPLTYILYVSTSDRAKTITGVINSTDSVLGTWTYITGGTLGKYYTSELVVTDPLNRSISKQFTTFVAPAWTNPNATGNHAPLIGFAYEPAEVLVNQEVQFTDTSTDSDGSVIYWIWNFGDGTHSGDDLASGEQNPKHIYSSIGNYAVSLKVYDDKGFSNYTSKIVEVKEKVTPPENELPVAEFSYEPAEIFVGDSVQLTDTSYDSDGSVVKWAWNFGDGATSDEQNPTHSYSLPGNYTITLTVYDNLDASNTTSKTLQVKENVTPPENLPPTVDFSYTPGEVFVNDVVSFNEASNDQDGQVVAWLWQFGDGSNSTEANLTHAYSSAGTYTVSLTVYDNLGAENSTSKEIVVKVSPPTPSPPGGGVSGGGGGGMYLSQPTPIIKKNGTTYLGFHPSFALNGTRTYSYDPSTNTTTIIFKLTNLARFSRFLSIRDLITKDMATSMMDVQVIPVPTNLYNMDPDIGWNVTLGAQETFTAKYIFNKYIPFASFDAMPLPTVTELKVVSGVPTEVPVSPTTKVTVPGGITGFVITTLSNPWAGVVIVIVILVLFFASTETGRETWGKMATRTSNFISSIAEELEEPKEYKRDRGERVKKLKKLMKKKRR